MLSRRFLARCAVWLGLALAATAQAQTPPQTLPEAPALTPKTRPTIGLVLSGGGARGLAHVGVLKVLERERIPIDLIVGTSMGAIVGGLYATGMGADELERELLAVRWDDVFAARVSRQELPLRRKELDSEISTTLELGFRDGELRVPQAAVSSRGLESLLRRYTLPVRRVSDFNLLPIPFRAIATDMESGATVEMAQGDLAVALRSSMSVPGVFSPIESNGRILGDGGLVNNLPVDVARRMGADIVIAVNVGTPVAGRETLSSVLGLTAQMINILTEQNVKRSIATLTERDLLLLPALGKLSSGDFDKMAELVAVGGAAAEVAVPRLQALALDVPRYAEWGQRHAEPARTPVTLSFVAFEGTTVSNPERLAPQLESKAGKAFDPAAAERDTRRLAATGDYVRADYRLVSSAAGDGLLFDLDDKTWGPNYLRAGLDLSTNFVGRSGFNLKIVHERHWLTPSGTEWRNRLHIGESPLLSSELMHPLRWSTSAADDWFVAGYGVAESPPTAVYDAEGDQIASFERISTTLGVDLGQPWGPFGEVRFGLLANRQATSARVTDARYTGPRGKDVTYEAGVRARIVVDQLDYALFPQRGYRYELQGVVGERRGTADEPFHRVQGSGTYVRSFGRHTLNAYALASLSDEGGNPLVGRFALGGFHTLSGYEPGQLNGNHLLFGRLTWYMRMNQAVALTRGFFVGATLEAGNTWLQRKEIALRDLRAGGSVFLGADTGIGPMYLGITTAPGGSTGIAFFIGRP